MTSNNTQQQLATINSEQLDAIVEIILAAPLGAAPSSIAEVLEVTVNDAVDRAFELEKLTKIAAEDYFAETSIRPLPSMVAIIVESVWNTIHREQDPNDQHHGGLLPGFEQDPDNAEANDRLDRNPEAKTRLIEAVASDTTEDVPAVDIIRRASALVDAARDTVAELNNELEHTGTAVTATINDDGGSDPHPYADMRPNGTPYETGTRYDVGGTLPPDDTIIEPANDPEFLTKLIDEARADYTGRGNLTGPTSSPRFGVDEVPPVIQTTRRVGNHAAPEPDNE